MCGIVGYSGEKQASSVMLDCLEKLEYRGYDSAGLAVFDGKITTEKSAGRLSKLKDIVEKSPEKYKGKIGIGHTRWATHGAPTKINSHPHTNKDKSIAVVHNGIIENYLDIKNMLMEKGHKFVSDTDTEVVAHLLDYYYEDCPLTAIAKTLKEIRGSYALGIMFEKVPDKIFAVRKDSPLIVGAGKDGNYIASDVPAFLKHTRTVYFLEENEIAEISSDKIDFHDLDQNEITKEVKHIDWDMESAEKGGHKHFMLKEMLEQPTVIANTINSHIDNFAFDSGNMDIEYLKKLDKIMIIACGTAYHAGLVAKYSLEHYLRIPVDVCLASEYRYGEPIYTKNTLCIAISQSGETLDTLAAIRMTKKNKIPVLSIVNVVGSSIARESDAVLYTVAGPEIAVASTKAYSCQISLLYVLAAHLAKLRGINVDTNDIKHLPVLIQDVIDNIKPIEEYAKEFVNVDSSFFLGRNIDYVVAQEGSLKLKEISYIHTESYAAGELKHGTISLIEDGTLVVAIATNDDLIEKMISNIKEVKARGAKVLAITKNGRENIADVADFVYYLPEVSKLLSPSLSVIPLQFLAYYIADMRGCDVDKPRNLAKSVTVE